MEKYLEKDGIGSKRTNIVVIPGFSGKALVDQTCIHFVEWLHRVFAKYTTPTTIWIFQHPLNIERLASWDEYPYAGENLLHQLKEKYIDEQASEDDSLILIGHKLGGFILKKALIDADRKAHHSHEKDILESLDCLLMLGDPHLHRDNRPDWINLISGCLPSTKPLPQRLSVDQSVQCLQAISSKFEDFRLSSWLFQMSGTSKVKRKGVLKFKRHEKKDGCIRSATVAIRMWSTQDPERPVPEGIGQAEFCAFNSGSTHYENLLNAFEENLEHKFLPSTGPTLSTTTGAIGSTVPTDFTTDLANMSSDGLDAPNLALPALPAADTCSCLLDPVDAGNEPLPGSLQDCGERRRKAPEDPVLANTATEGTPISDVAEWESPRMRVQDCPKTASTIPTLDSEQDFGSMDPLPLHFETRNSPCDASSCNRSLTTVQNVSAPLLPSRVKLPCRYNIPEHLSCPFFGREKTLSRLGSFFSVEDESVAKSSPVLPRQFYLSGPGGCGKTQIALEYVDRYLEKFDVLLWLRSSTAVSLAQNFHAAAQNLGLIEDQVKHDHIESRQKLRWWLETANRPFLLIFDDVENYAMLKKYIPYSSQGHIIITSRRPYNGSQDRNGSPQLVVEEIGPFSVEEAVSFLNNRVPQAIEKDDPMAPRVIAEQLGNFPLALNHCASYIAHTQCTFREYATILAEQRAFNELSAQPGIKQVNLRFFRRTDFADYCSKFHWSDFSKPAASMMSVICFLDPWHVSESILLSARLDNNLPSNGFPRSERAFCDARSELLMHDVCSRSKSKTSLYTNTMMADNMRASMDSALFETGFKTASRLLMNEWPSRRKLPNVLQANWPEFDALHNHVWRLTNIYQDCPSSTTDMSDSDISTYARAWILQESLISDDFVRLLVYSTWYNAHRGNTDEDNPLLAVACDILQVSSLRSADGRGWEIPDTSSLIFTDTLDNLLKIVAHAPEIVSQNKPNLSTQQKDSQDSSKTHSSVFKDTRGRPPKRAEKSKQAAHPPPANHQRLQEADIKSCTATVQQGLHLACDNRITEALAKLQQAKDQVSAFKQPTEASVSLCSSASLYQGHLYLAQGLAEAASATFQAVSKLVKDFEALVRDPFLLGRLEFGLASAETEASEVKIQHYKRALDLFESTEGNPETVTEKNDWVAVARLKLSDAYLQASPQDIPAAAVELQKTLDHFQTQKTTRAHFHTARALYKRASIFDAQGNSMMKMAFQAAARETWAQTAGADGAAVGQSLTLQDFDDKIAEPWFK